MDRILNDEMYDDFKANVVDMQQTSGGKSQKGSNSGISSLVERELPKAKRLQVTAWFSSTQLNTVPMVK